MSWMKYVVQIQQSAVATNNLRKAVTSAEKYNLKYANFEGQLIKTDRLRAILDLIDKSNDSIHREPDDTTGVIE